MAHFLDIIPMEELLIRNYSKLGVVPNCKSLQVENNYQLGVIPRVTYCVTHSVIFPRKLFKPSILTSNIWIFRKKWNAKNILHKYLNG